MVLKRVGSIFIGLGMLLMAFSYAPPTADAAFGNVSTFIGQISAGDGGQALNAYFDFPEDMAVDSTGNFYLADTFDHSIRKIATNGVVSTFAGTGSVGLINGANASAEFFSPRGIAVGSNGAVYVADSGNNVIRKISGGTVSTLVSSGLNNPQGLAVYGSTLYISDSGNNAIKKVSTSGGSVSTVTTGVNDPRKLVVNAAGTTMYVADNGNHRVISVATSNGAVSVIAGNGTAGYAEGAGTSARFQNIWGLALNGTTLYVTDHDGFVTDRIRKINLSNNTTSLFASDQRQQTMIFPGALAIKNGYLYALMNGLGTIHQFLLTNSDTDAKFAGKERFQNKTGIDALIARPKDLVADPNGTFVFFSENNRIRKFNTSTGAVTHVIGDAVDNYREGTDYGALPMRFSGPEAITVNATGTRLYVADRWNNRIRGVNLETSPVSSYLVTGAGLINTNGSQNNGYQEGTKCSGVLTTGTSGCSYFKNPGGIVIDSSNAYLYVSDTGNNRIRKVRISDGYTWFIAGSGTAGFADGAGSGAKFNRPYGLAIDSSGRYLYVADTNNHRIRKIDLSTNTVSTILGTGVGGYLDAQASKAVLSFPEYVRVMSNGDVYFTEAGSGRIRTYDVSAGVTKLVAGPGKSGLVNGSASVAEFYNLKGFNVDLQNEKLYVADSWNDVIRQVDIAGDAPFTEPAPTLGGVSPTLVNPTWEQGFGLHVQVNGTNFRYGAETYFGDYKSDKTYVQSGTSLSVRLPLGPMAAGVYDITVINSDGQKITLERALTLTNTNGTTSGTYYPYSGKSEATVTNPYTVKVAPGFSFFAYDQAVRGGFDTDTGNVSGNSKDEIVVGTGVGLAPEVVIANDQGTVLKRFFAYFAFLRSGVRVTVCDVKGDAKEEIITAPGPGGGPHIRIFDGDGNEVLPSFFALDGKFRGGAYVACDDVNGDGKNEIIVTAGKGGGAQVTVHRPNGQIVANFFAYDRAFRNGIKVTTADIDGDGQAEILTGPEFGSPHIQTFKIRPGEVKRLNPGFYAFHPQYKGGVDVAGADIDGDGSDEIIVSVGENAEPLVKIYNKTGVIIRQQFFAYATNLLNGVNVSGGDVDGDGIDEVITTPRGGGGPNVRIIEVDKL